jgi:hypothetical protein
MDAQATGSVQLFERKTALFTHQIARDVHAERQRDIERHLYLRVQASESPPRQSVRKRVGRGLIQLGSVIAADGPLQLSARR